MLSAHPAEVWLERKAKGVTITVLSLILALAAPIAAEGADVREEGGALRFGNGVVEMRFDRATGLCAALARVGEPSVLGTAGGPASAIGVRTGGDWTPESAASRAISHRVEKTAGGTALTLVRRQGDWEIAERWEIRAGLDLVTRSARLTWRGAEPVVVEGVRFALREARVGPVADCRYLAVDPFPPTETAFTSLQPGRSTWLSGQTNQIAVVSDSRRKESLAALALCPTDPSGGQVVEGDGWVEIQHDLRVAQEIRPGEAFSVGSQHLRLVAGDAGDALAAAQAVYALTGWTTPADSPPDAAACAIYSLHPGGTIDSGFRDGAGFRGVAERLPRLCDLGLNTFWLLPFWHGHVYAPIAYDRLDERLGGEGDLAALADAAHRQGARVLADLIPHGPRPESGLERTHPEWISRDRDGGFRFMWGCYACDNAHPGWQGFMAEHAADWVRRVDLDGYRVDVALGGPENWRPAPGNRPSSSRVGGITLLGEVRRALHARKPSAILLAEGTHPGLWQACDMVYDFPFAYQVAPQALTMPPARFVPAMREWLQRQRATLPDGARLMRYVESHDTVRAGLRYGPGLHRAFLALFAMAQGVPMLYDGEESGQERFLYAVLAARRAHPVLWRGAADYLAVETTAPEVCAILRSLPDAAAIGAISFGGEERSVRLSLDVSRLPAGVVAGPWHDALGSPIRVQRAGGRVTFTVTLPAHGAAILVPGPAQVPAPVPAAPPASATVDSAGCVEHRAKEYRLLVDRRTGLLRSLEAPDGTPLLSRMALAEGPRRLFLGGKAFDAARASGARFVEEVRGGRRTLSFDGRAQGPDGEALFDYALRYRADDGRTLRVEVELTARRPVADVNAALRQTLRLAPGGEWFAETLEGDLRGEAAPGPTAAEEIAGWRYRHRVPWPLWEDRLFPLSGSFGARRSGGYGVAIHDVAASDPLWRQNAVLLPPSAAAPECRAELRWLDGKAPISLPAGGGVTLGFAVTVLPPNAPLPPAPAPAAGPRLAVEGPRYTVSNAHYAATLVRSRGAALVSLAPRAGESLVVDSAIYTDHGLYDDTTDPAGVRHRTHASTSEDVETEVSAHREGRRLVLVAESVLRNTGEGHGAVARPTTRTRVRYTFDEGPDVGVEVSILPPLGTEAPVFLAQTLHLRGIEGWRVGERRFDAAARSADRAWESKKDPLPPGAPLTFEGKDGALTVHGLELPPGFANVFVHDSGGGNVTLFAAPCDMTPLPERRWLTFRYRLRASRDQSSVASDQSSGAGPAAASTTHHSPLTTHSAQPLTTHPGQPRPTYAGAVLSNAHLRCTLDTQRGGLPARLEDAAGRVLWQDARLYSDRGICGTAPVVSSVNCGAAQVSVVEEGERVRVVAAGRLDPPPGQRVADPVSYRVTYTLGRGPELAIRVELSTPVDRLEAKGFLALAASIPGVRQWYARTLDGLASEDFGERTDRVWQSATEGLDPDRPEMGALWPDGTRLVIEGLRADGPLGNAFWHQGQPGSPNLFLAWLSGERTHAWKADRPWAVEFTLRVAPRR